jgi:hypothetical protein
MPTAIATSAQGEMVPSDQIGPGVGSQGRRTGLDGRLQEWAGFSVERRHTYTSQHRPIGRCVEEKKG